MAIEKAAECFERLMREAKKDVFKKNLERIRIACDEIVRMGGVLNKSRVGAYIKNHLKTPSLSSIMQRKRFGTYIESRTVEYESGKKIQSDTRKEKSTPERPPGLNALANTYITQLEQEVATLTGFVQFLKEQLNLESKKNPIRYSEMVSSGAQNDGSMDIIRRDEPSDDGVLTVEGRKAIKKMLALTSNPETYLEIFKEENEEWMMLNTPSVTKVILSPSELMELRRIASCA